MKVRPQIIKPSWYPRSPSDPSWESLSLLEKMSVLTQRADANKPCGVFRKCNFPDGPAWIAQTNHPHAQGHTVRVQKRAGGAEGLRAPNCTTHLKPEGLDEERTLAWMRDTVGLEVTFLAVREA